MLLYGAGGHGKVVLSCILASNDPVHAIFDDHHDKAELMGIPVYERYNPDLFKTESILISVGDNKLRRLISQKVRHTFGIVRHPSAFTDPDVRIPAGSVLLHGSIVQTGSVIGQHVIVNTHVSVNHDCVIGDFVHLAPGVVLCGNVHVGANTFVGAGTIITPNLTIGSNCFIAAGSVITNHIPDNSTVRGNPGRIIRTVS